jgi:DNA topoisomerase-3
MKRFADSIARQKRIKPPPGYAKSGSICRAFLDQHVPKRAADAKATDIGPKPVSPAQMLYAIKVAQAKGIVIPHEVKTSSTAMSAWIDANRDGAPGKRGRKTGNKRARPAAPGSTAPKKRSRKRKVDADGAIAQPTPQKSGGNTPLQIPYGNKDLAQKLGARYGAGGWYAPPGIDLAAFRAQGWL